MNAAATRARVGFALGGGGVHGAAEVGMLKALDEAGIVPELVVGTSIGAVNGAVIAANPGPTGVARLTRLWDELEGSGILSGALIGRLSTLLRTRTHLHSLGPLQALLERNLPGTFAELELPFQCVAASVERAGARWFSDGPLVSAILASCAVPGLFPPVELGGEHYVDGGLVHSIPVGRAVELGATEIFVLHVGRIENPLRKPRNPLEVALAAFEIGRRHRFVEELERLPESVRAHVLPADAEGLSFNDLRQFRYWDARRIDTVIERARTATGRYLAEAVNGG
jgi:NTE family protein